MLPSIQPVGALRKWQERLRTAAVSKLRSLSPTTGTLALLLLCSGASSLIFETIFTRLLTYTFGNTAYAVSTVLAAFLGGLALGALLIGRWVDRRPPSLRIYAALEITAATFCLFLPSCFSLVTSTYVALYHRFQLGPASLTAVRFGLAALVIALPAALMGGSLPALARYVSASSENPAPEVDRLYARNTLGAALGTLAATFVLMPVWGVKGTIYAAFGINALIALGALLLSRRTRLPLASIPPHTDGGLAARKENGPLARMLLLGSFLTGAVALAYEVLWTHVLAFTIGNSVYAFGVMLFALLCGLAWGAEIVSRRFARPAAWGPALAVSQLLLGFAVLITTPFWDRVPQFFNLGLGRAAPLSLGLLLAVRISIVLARNRRTPASLIAPAFRPAGSEPPGPFRWLRRNEPLLDCLLFCALAAGSSVLWKHDSTFFVASELVRFACAFFLLIGPSLLVGVSFPLLLNLYGRQAGSAGAGVGGVYAANTLGAILGSLLAGFVLLPRFGSLSSLRGAATANVLLAAFFALLLLPERRTRTLAWALAVVPAVSMLWWFPRGWDIRRMTVGSYVYVGAADKVDRVLYSREDSQGGLTSVVQVGGAEHILLSNGKFQGGNKGEVPAQVRFALTPLLFTRHFQNALVIGLGTGNTLHTVSRFPFARIDVAELAPAIVEAARLWFQDVNGRELDTDPRVRLSVTDGRNFLLLSRQQYDLITIELTSIWISGEADLYNREFYQLCRRHLGERGVLQQWVQIHHMRTEDFLVVLNTAARVFPHVAFFQGPEQGLLIASNSPLELDYAAIAAFDRDPGIRPELKAAGIPSMASLLGELLLYDASLRQAVSNLPALTGRPADFVSSDFYPYLEYQTPKANVLPYDTAGPNLRFVKRFSPPGLPAEMAVRNLPSSGDRDLLLAYVLEQRRRPAAAIAALQNVTGPARAQAQSEIQRIGNGGLSVSP